MTCRIWLPVFRSRQFGGILQGIEAKGRIDN